MKIFVKSNIVRQVQLTMKEVLVKFVKNWKRNSMEQKRLTSLMIFCIHSDTDELHIDDLLILTNILTNLPFININ